MPDSNYEIDILFTLNEASARRAAEEARRIFNSGGSWGPNFGAGQGGGQGGGGGGGGRAGAAPRDPSEGSNARWQRLESQLNITVGDLRKLSRAAGDVAAAMRVVTQQTLERRYGGNAVGYAQRVAFDRAERAAGAFEGAHQARLDGPYAGNSYQDAHEQARFTTARQTNLNAARTALGALDAETQYSIGLNKASHERRRAFEQLARSQYDSTSPVQLSAATSSHINAFDPGILPAAEREATHRARQEAEATQRANLSTYLQSGNASWAQKLDATLLGRAPGDAKIPGQRGGFWEGMLGGEGNFTKVIGQAARFGVVYGALYSVMGAVTSGFSAAAKGAADYEEALIALNLATAQSTEQNSGLANAALRAGTALGFGPAEGVQAASRAIGLYDLNAAGTTDQDRQELALLSTNVAGRIARVSGQPLDQVQTQVAGLVRSFNLSPFEQSRVEDQLAVISRQSGRNPADLLQAGTQIGQIANTAGYDLPDTLAIISRVSSQTGQSADAVAGQLSQVLSKANDPAALSKLASVGVNVQGTTLKQQIEQLAALNLDPASRSQVVQGFGRSRSGASFDILLSQIGRINELAAQGRSAAPGSGEQTFETVMSALSKQLLEFKGSLQNIANGLAQAGLFQAVGHLVVLLGTMAKIVDRVISVYNSLPAPLREGIAGIIEATLAIRLFTFLMNSAAIKQGLGSVAGFLGGLRGGGKAGPLASGKLSGISWGPATAREAYVASALAATQRGESVLAARVAGGTASLGTRGAAGAALAAGAGGLAGLGRVGLAAVGGVPGLVIGGAVLAGAGLYNADEASRRTQDLSRQAGSAAGAAGTAAELKEAAGRYDQAVQAAQKQQELSLSNFLDQGLAPWLLRLEGSGSGAAQAETQGQARSVELREQAKELEKAHQAGIVANGANAFQDFSSSEAVGNSLEILSKRGYSAAQQLAALNTAMDGFIASSSKVGGAFGYIQAGAQEEFRAAAASAPGRATAATRLKLQNSIQGLDPVSEMGPWDRYWSGAYHGMFGWDRTYDLPGSTKDALDVDRADRGILDKIDQKGMSKEANSRIGSYLRSIGKSGPGAVALGSDEIARIKEIEGEVTAKYAPGLSRETDIDLKRNLEKSFNEATGSFINTKATLNDVVSYVGGAVPLAESAAQDQADIARDPSIKPGIQLKNLEEERRKALALAATIDTSTPEGVKEKADAINAINTKLDAEIARTYDEDNKARAEVIDRQTAGAQSRLALEDTVGRALLEVSALEQKLKSPNLSKINRDQYETQLREKRAQVAQQEREGGRATRLGQIQLNGYTGGTYNAPDQKRILDENLKNAQEDVDRLKSLPDTNSAKGEALQRLADAAKAEKDYADAVNLAAKKLAAPANDQVAQTQVDLDEARRVYGEALKSGDAKAINEAGLDVRAKQAAHVQAIQQHDSAQREANTPQNSVLGAVKNRLADAAQALDDAKNKHVGDVLSAQAAYNKALYEYSSAQLDLAQQLDRSYDFTDPIQAGQKGLKDITDRLKARDKNGNLLEADPDRRALLAKDADHQRIANEKTAFDQRQKDISDYEQIGRITHADALQMRKADRAQLAAEIASMKTTDEGYRQKQDELTELDKTIKSATDRFQGQFNIGQIKLPTVYEIRRSLGVGPADTRTSVGDYVTNNVSINGADFTKVVAYLNGVLGLTKQPVRSSHPRSVG